MVLPAFTPDKCNGKLLQQFVAFGRCSRLLGPPPLRVFLAARLVERPSSLISCFAVVSSCWVDPITDGVCAKAVHRNVRLATILKTFFIFSSSWVAYRSRSIIMVILVTLDQVFAAELKIN